MSKDKLYVVVEQDHYNEEGCCWNYRVSDIYGPFSKDVAKSVAHKFNDMNMYATQFKALPLNSSTDHNQSQHHRKPTVTQKKRYKRQGI